MHSMKPTQTNTKKELSFFLLLCLVREPRNIQYSETREYVTNE